MDDLTKSFEIAQDGSRGDQSQMIIEEFISFESEITLLTIRDSKGHTHFCEPIGHRQEQGDYRESWQPAGISKKLVKRAKDMALQMTTELGGVGLFGVEFFVTKSEVIFSELSPRPHDTGMVTLASQNYSEFDLHAKAILGLPIPKIKLTKPAATRVILADRDSDKIKYLGVDKALEVKNVDVRIFGKETARPNRRMGVTLAKAKDPKTAIQRAVKAASMISLEYD
jgi:phosphoribosylglycinamide formyltransferase 2